ncbi:MAG: hypothetical protein FWC36_04165 [Spirochaetes bacterium]|nr:hypothetical protein [Spirochaetota bacterium]
MKKAVLLLISVAIIAGLMSCTTYSQRRSSSDRIIGLVNAQEGAWLGGATALPFLFDREIIVLERDSNMIWQNITNAGFSFEEIISVESIPVSSGDYRFFGDTFEVRTWFKNHLPRRASLVKINCKNGLYYMILGGRTRVRAESSGARRTLPAIHGFTGPVEVR